MALEKTTTYISYGLALTSASIYCFALGYLDFFKITDYPSWFNSHVFFLSVALSKSAGILFKETIDFSLDKSFLIPVMSSIVSIATFLVVEFYRIKDKLPNKVKYTFQKIFKVIFGSLAISSIVVILIIIVFKDAMVFMLPVLIAPLGTLFLGKTFVERLEKSKSSSLITKNTNFDDLAVWALALIIAWILPYKMGNTTASKLNPIKSFPSAWSGGPYTSSDLLVWKEDDKGFWINCKERVIYGITNEGHIFFNRATSVLNSIECE